jgi:hypothetical protein
MASGTDGEILTYDASGNPVAVSVGTDGQVLTSTGVGSPPAFEAAAAGGKVLQVVTVVKSDRFSTTNQDTNYVDITGLSVSITPSATTSKILVQVNIGKTACSNAAMVTNFVVLRGSTALAIGDAYSSNPRVSFTASNPAAHAPSAAAGFLYLDEPTIPATPVAITYKVQMAGHRGTDTHTINGQTYTLTSSDAPESRTTSTIVLMEIGA